MQSRGSAKESSVMRSRIGLTATLIIGLLAWASVGPRAQAPAVQPVSPFDIVGFIDAATVDDPTDVFSGGTLTVDGTKYIVPRNTLLQMPAFALTWQEVFAQAPAPYGLASSPTGGPQSGLARADIPAPMTTYEIHVAGNRVASGGGDQAIVGLMFIAQQSLNNGAGFINYIDYATGEMRVGGTIGDATTGARVAINDPAGKFGRVRTHDPRFTIDEDNPTIRTETGYPMCVPRTDPAIADDPLCPQKNRPKGTDGNYLTIFTMDALPFDGSEPAGTDPRLMAPFEVGDFIDYNGNLVLDASGNPYVSAWGVIDNIGLFTAPGTLPVYTAIDTMLLGVAGTPVPALPQEATVRTRIEGFTTDPTSFVDLFAVDVDACNGAQTWRYYATVAVDPGAPNGAVAGRWRWRPSSIEATFLPPTRMLLAVSENGIVDTPTRNGLFAGQYIAPNFEFLFPENLGIGNPPVPNNFQDFPFLTTGSGPYPAPGPSSIGILGGLSPWPGSVAPLQPVCAGTNGSAVFSPIADAGIHQSVSPGATVTLDATLSKDTNVPPLPLTFSWVQTGGPHVGLANATTAQPSFTAPPLNPLTLAPETLEFTVTVNNGVLTSSARVTVTDAQPAVPTDTITITTATFRIARSRLLVNASTSDPNAVLIVQGFGEMGPALPVVLGVPAPPTDRTFRQVGVNPQPQFITVTSSLGGSATLAVTVR
jgi:hypothetical protein